MLSFVDAVLKSPSIMGTAWTCFHYVMISSIAIVLLFIQDPKRLIILIIAQIAIYSANCYYGDCPINLIEKYYNRNYTLADFVSLYTKNYDPDHPDHRKLAGSILVIGGLALATLKLAVILFAPFIVNALQT